MKYNKKTFPTPGYFESVLAARTEIGRKLVIAVKGIQLPFQPPKPTPLHPVIAFYWDNRKVSLTESIFFTELADLLLTA